jgi:hypothetical protein
MMKKNVSSELAFHIKATRTGDIPLEIYDALYYSGRFEPIYRIQGDMVLGAYYKAPGSREGGLRKMGKRILKELTIDFKEKPFGNEVRVENLMPVFEEEASFYRDPRVRISCKSNLNAVTAGASIAEQIKLLAEAEQILLQIHGLNRMEEARISLTLHESVFDVAKVKSLAEKLNESSITCSVTKRTWSLNFTRRRIDDLIVPEIVNVLSTMTVQG